MSSIVAPPATATDNAKKGIPRLAFREPSIGSTTTCVAPPEPKSRSPSSSEISVKSPPAASSRRTIADSAAASIAVVSSPPSPAPTTGSRSSRVGSSTSTPRTSSTAARQTESQSSVKREEQQAGDELRIEVGALLRHRLAPLGDDEHVLDPRRAHQHRHGGLAGVDRPHRLVPVGRVADPVVPEPVDEADVELVAVHGQLGAPGPVEHCGGAAGRHSLERLESGSRIAQPVL